MTIAALVLALITVPAPDSNAIRGPAILDFHAEWCGPCRQMRPEIEELINNQYPVQSFDVDDHPELARRYQVEGLPTFVIIDSEGHAIDRSEGYQPAARLAKTFKEAVASTAPPASQPITRQASAAQSQTGNPRPWETVARITVHDNGSLGYGSGTVILSNSEEAIILTCAHIFQTGNRRQPYQPKDFPLKVSVELFDGKLTGERKQMVSPLGEKLRAEVIDYDFDRDVGLVRIRPGRVIPAAKVVPPHWKPKQNMSMYTVGCSQGNDATAWNTVITNPLHKGLGGNSVYEAIQCKFSPKQGRSGGGLFTDDGYVAGVCNFAFDRRVDQGLYASPRSIYRILDRNRLQVAYQPSTGRPGTQLAGNRSEPAENPSSPVVRAQGPDLPSDSPERTARDRGGSMPTITVPPPELLGVHPLPHDEARPEQPSVSQRENRDGDTWRAVESARNREVRKLPIEHAEGQQTVTTEMKLDPNRDWEPPHRFPSADSSRSNPNTSDSARSRTATPWKPLTSRDRP